MAAPIGWTDDGFQTAEKSARSVFVGNIPYDTSEEQLKVRIRECRVKDLEVNQ
jgi:hypothetical protein